MSSFIMEPFFFLEHLDHSFEIQGMLEILMAAAPS
jgi:hypothetical protein